MVTTLRLLPDLEATIGRLPGVQAARVVTDGAAAPTEIHVLSDRGKSPKALVRDIQSVAMAQFDLELDHRIVSIVQFDDDETPQAETQGTSTVRVLVAGVTANTAGLHASATVTLACNGQLYDGTATAPATPSSRIRLIGRATLAAAMQLFPLAAADLEHAQVSHVGGREVAICVIQLLTADGESMLTGSALVRGDQADAVVRAVLDGLNRRLRL
ncbi:MAG TPA: hypothetical protein VNB94_10000 [Mycobacteriales bacterium]|nr:hypothetical protein [Mycobacteriales bacterium]